MKENAILGLVIVLSVVVALQANKALDKSLGN